MEISNINVSAISNALAKAKERKAVKESVQNEAGTATDNAKQKDTKLVENVKKNEEKANRKAFRDEERAKRRAEKQAANMSKKPSHMMKVARALNKLVPLNDQLQLTFNEITCNFSALQIDALASHLQHYNRSMATTNAMNSTILKIGQTVQITGGDPKFIGMIGKVAKSSQLRVKIDVPNQKKLVYIFTGQAKLYAEDSSISAAS